MSMLQLASGVLGLLGRARGAGAARAPRQEDDPTHGAPAVARPQDVGYLAPISRPGPETDDATRILDRNMNYSPDPRTGRIPRGMYRGKTAAEARRAAQREAEVERENIGSRRSGPASLAPSPEAAAREEKAKAGIAAGNETLARARDDRRGLSVWRNNGDGTATSGSYGAGNKFSGQTRDIVPRLSPGEVATVKADQAIPKGANADTHVVYEGKPDGTVVAKAMPTITPQGTITVLGKDGRMHSTNANDAVPTNAPLVAKAPPAPAAPAPAATAEDDTKKPTWARPFRAGPRA